MSSAWSASVRPSSPVTTRALLLSRSLSLSLLVALACGGDDEATDASTDARLPPQDANGLDAFVPPRDAGGDATQPGDDAGHDAGPIGSPGCVEGEGLESGEHRFTLDGMERRFLLYVPSGYTRERSWPVVLALHGNGGSASYWNGTSGDRNVREAFGDAAILVIAEAIGGNWRDYDMPADTWPARVELELAYFDAIRSTLRESLCVNDDAIFSMGFSGGGSFSGLLGCRREWIRAIAVGGSVRYFGEDECVSTPAAWITIGAMELNAGRAAFREFFRDAAGCDATSGAVEPSPCVAYDGCVESTPVHYCEHPGGHVWPSFGTAAAAAFFARFTD